MKIAEAEAAWSAAHWNRHESAAETDEEVTRAVSHALQMIALGDGGLIDELIEEGVLTADDVVREHIITTARLMAGTEKSHEVMVAYLERKYARRPA